MLTPKLRINLLRKNLLEMICAAGAVVLLYFPVFLGTDFALNNSDALQLTLTRTAVFVQALWEGSLPQWNPYVNLGQAATDGAGYPFSLLTIFSLFLPLPLAHTVYLLLLLWGYFLFTWKYLRSFHFSLPATFCGLIVYCLSGPVFFHHSYTTDLIVLTGIPLALYIIRLWDEKRSRNLLVAFFILSFVITAGGNIDMVLYYFAIITLERTARLFLSSKNHKNIFGLWMALLATILIAAAFFLLPLLEWTAYSSRLQMSYGDNFYPPPAELLQAVSLGSFDAFDGYRPYYFFIGIPAIFLSIAGFFSIREKYLKVYSVLGLAFLFKYILFYILHRQGTDYISYADHWRSLAGFMIIASVNTACGAERLIAFFSGSNKKSFLKSAWVFVLVLFFVQNFILARRHIQEFCLSGRADNILGYAGWWAGNRDKMRHPQGAGRIAGASALLSVATGGGIRVMPAYTNIYNRAFQRQLKEKEKILQSPKEGFASLWWHLRSPRAHKLSLYGVQFMLIPPGKHIPPEQINDWALREDLSFPNEEGPFVYENKFFSGRAYLLDAAENRRRGGVRLTDLSSKKVVCYIENAAPGDHMILADQFFPGWEVRINGKRAVYEPYLGCLRQIKLPPGPSEVIWTYRPRMFMPGLCLSVIGLFLAACIVRAMTPASKEG